MQQCQWLPELRLAVVLPPARGTSSSTACPAVPSTRGGHGKAAAASPAAVQGSGCMEWGAASPRPGGGGQMQGTHHAAGGCGGGSRGKRRGRSPGRSGGRSWGQPLRSPWGTPLRFRAPIQNWKPGGGTRPHRQRCNCDLRSWSSSSVATGQQRRERGAPSLLPRLTWRREDEAHDGWRFLTKLLLLLLPARQQLTAVDQRQLLHCLDPGCVSWSHVTASTISL